MNLMDNPALGRKVLDEIDNHPDRLNMSTWGNGSIDPATGEAWPCGTTACLAGHTMLLSGYKMRNGVFYDEDGAWVLSESRTAAELLGLDSFSVFFDYERGVEQLRQIVEDTEEFDRRTGRRNDGS